VRRDLRTIAIITYLLDREPFTIEMGVKKQR